MINYHNNKSLENISEIINEELIIEQWKTIFGYEGKYEISSFGRIKSLHRETKIYCAVRIDKEKILSQRMSERGYMYVWLSNGRKKRNCQVHRLVGAAFIPNPENKPRINHKWGIKHDNRVSELEWATASEDELHSYRVLGKKNNKTMLGKIGNLHPRSKRVVCSTLNMEFESGQQAAIQLGISQSNLWMVLAGRRPYTNGLYFRYAK